MGCQPRAGSVYRSLYPIVFNLYHTCGRGAGSLAEPPGHRAQPLPGTGFQEVLEPMVDDDVRCRRAVQETEAMEEK